MSETNKSREALKPCPFCNDDGEKWADGIATLDGVLLNDWVKCLVCNAVARRHNWNSRPTEDASRAAALEEAAKVCDARAADNWGMTEAECEAQECSEAIRAIARKE